MRLYTKEDTTARLVAELARRRGVTRQDAVKIAVAAKLDRMAEAVPLRDRFAALRREHRLPPPTEQSADKALFDEFSGGLR
jgi:antitoxin VapB